jgi:DNA-binding MarR family transcriptional regulator
MAQSTNSSSCNATAIRKASRRLTQLYDQALEGSGLRSTQYSLLTAIRNQGDEPPTISALSEELVLDRSALGHNLRPLEREGWIVLARDAADQRRRHVKLTAAGERRLDKAQKLWQKAQDHFNSVYGIEKAKALRDTMLTLANDDRLVQLPGAVG